MDKINILLSVNKQFLEYIEELIASILYYSSRNVNFYLMYIENELNLDDLKYLEKFINKYKNGKIIPVKFNAKELKGMPVTDGNGAFFGLEAYSRIFSAFKLPKQLHRVLYLDADMVCTGDIAELYNIDFEGKMWCGCYDKGIKPEQLERLSLPRDYKYINSGMLLINLKKIREDYTEERIIELIRENKDILVYPDQDFINKIFCGEIKTIDPKYNLIAKDTRYSELREKPLIIHYAGSVKPWNENVSRFEIEYIKPYYKALEIQADYKKEKLKNLINKHKQYGYKT